MLFLLALMALLLPVRGQDKQDQHASCAFWASIDECTKNPGYMVSNCPVSCATKSTTTPETTQITSFYDLKETSMDNKPLTFEWFRGRVVYIVNVASYCGYTADNYAQFRALKKYSPEGLVMLLAPCNSFGSQEPGDAVAIAAFAQSQEFNGIILAKGEVNGDNTRPLFEFLKRVAQRPQISWNFDGKFLVSRSGEVFAVTADSLEEQVKTLLAEPYNTEL
ncbi:thioredoxin-like protein [Ochromonadaceae sp. CCMP2298]|nr:thioredoxin-like protein [Ochromonadaceae sp. CCMP2298]|mmetsp:Transcript_3650/g.8263  ORF Transcript_3650/g.8263 Transcript_3650/m.8263 type:complete len:221 (+) Transcript_3650:200-862(+)